MGFFAKGKMPNPRVSEWHIFCYLFAPLKSNVSGSSQNIKNLVGNLLGKGSSCLRAKN